MISWTDIKNLDITDLDLGKVDVSRFDPRTMDLSAFATVPAFALPDFERPKLPEVELPTDVERVAGLARDAAYAGVGAVVVTAQKLDERRRDLTDQITTRVRKVVGTVA